MNQHQTNDWHYAGEADNFEDEDVEQIVIGPLAVAVYRAKGEFYATQDLCTHERAYLSDGVVIGCVVECPFHQGRFDIRNGKPQGAPVIVPIKTYPVKVDDGKIFVQVSLGQAASDAEQQSRYGQHGDDA